MKREYSTPAMKVEVFEASESVAACYTINCNTGRGILFRDTNKNGKYDRFEDETLYTNCHGCGKKHEAAGLPEGGLTANAWFKEYGIFGDTYEVFYWEEKDKNGNVVNVHFSKLGTEDWFKNPNAS